MMNKKNYILVGVSLLLQIIGLTVPFFGFGEDGLCTTELPISILVSLILLMQALKGLFNETDKKEFFNGFKFSVIGIFLIVVCTILSPVIAGGTLLSPGKYLSLVFESQDNEYLLYVYTSQFFKSLLALLVIVILGMIFYAIAINKFTSGVCTLNVETEHKNKLRKVTKTFSIVNVINMILLAIVILAFISFFEIIFKNAGSETLNDSDTTKLVVIFALLYLVLLPGVIVNSIFYYVNFVKSVIYMFKTPSKFIELEPETVELNSEE